jgi:hypothetical protein
MTFDASNPTYQELLGRVLQSGASVVPFVGAGLSVYGPEDQRLPLWRELLDRLIAEGQEAGLIPDAGDHVIDAALATRQYIRATDLILDALGEPTFRRPLRTITSLDTHALAAALAGSATNDEPDPRSDPPRSNDWASGLGSRELR